MIWSRADRPAQMVVEWSTEESLARAERVVGPTALEDGDFTARLDLGGLPPDQPIFYRVTFQDLANPRAMSEPASGRFRTAAMHRRNIRFVFSGDEAGQGWGINPGWGGYRLYARATPRQLGAASLPQINCHCPPWRRPGEPP